MARQIRCTDKKPPKKPAKSCKCFEQVQQKLKPHGLELEDEMFVNFSTGSAMMRGPLLRVKKTSDAPKKTKLRTVLCTFCPFCGKKLPQ